MPRKPNYKFERSQRAKNKAEKKAERLKAKTQKSEDKNTDTGESGNEERPA